LAVASRIASRPTSSSGLSRPPGAAVGNFCIHMHHHWTYDLYCTLIYGVHYYHINLWKMLTLTLTLTLNQTLTLILTVTVSENRNFNIKHNIVLQYTWNCRLLVNVNVKRNDASVDVNFSLDSICRNSVCRNIFVAFAGTFAMAASRYGGPSLSLWRPSL